MNRSVQLVKRFSKFTKIRYVLIKNVVIYTLVFILNKMFNY